VLDISELNKKFYKQLSNWYFWALQNVRFPDVMGENSENRRSMALIRMLTRIIFIWFLKEKKLIPEKLFDKSELGNILRDLSENESNYYKSLLSRY